MGNRAVIELEQSGLGIYMHWNGGRDSIEPLLHVAKEYKIQSKGKYFLLSSLCKMIANSFTSSTYSPVEANPIDTLDCDNFDNGVYVIDSRLNIVDRKFNRYPEQNEHDFYGMVEYIKEKNDEFFITNNSKD